MVGYPDPVAALFSGTGSSLRVVFGYRIQSPRCVRVPGPSFCVVFRFVKSDESQLLLQRFWQIVGHLQDFRDQVMSDWSCQLDSDCGLILDQPLIQHSQEGLLEVNCGHKVVETK